MKHLLRLLIASGSALIIAGDVALAAPTQHPPAIQSAPTMQGHGSQGYLGIVCSDIDSKRVGELKLKQAQGTEIVNVDRDAPAGKAGLRPHDVILQMNGLAITGEQQLRRMLHETPAGHTVTLLISRDGLQKTVTVQLADRATVEQNAWSQHIVIPAPEDQGEAFWGESSLHSLGSGFFSVFSIGPPSVGLELDTLGSQLADYFGVRDGQGLLVKRVTEDSPASRAGLRAGDVITKANGKKIVTLNEWVKMLHANRGKQIQLTLIRNRKEQTATLEAIGKRNHSGLVAPEGLQVINNSEPAKSSRLIAPEILMPGMPNGSDAAGLEALQAQLAEQGEEMELGIRQLEAEIESMGIESMGAASVN